MTDDTTLGRPPRHERPSQRSDFKPLAILVDVKPSEEADEAIPCAAECGRRVRVQIAGQLPRLSITIRQRQIAGDVPVYCRPCDDERDRVEEEREEAERRSCAFGRRLERSGVPHRWLTETWDGIELEGDARVQTVGALRAWADGKGARGILLWGPVGRGKSHLAAVAAVHRCRVSRVRWLNVADLLMQLGRGFADPARERAISALSPGGNVALVLDDFDKGRTTDHAVQPLYLAVNAWIEKQQPLLVTMNRNLDTLADDLGERYGEAIASRLAGYCEVFEVGGRDRRLDP